MFLTLWAYVTCCGGCLMWLCGYPGREVVLSQVALCGICLTIEHTEKYVYIPRLWP